MSSKHRLLASLFTVGDMGCGSTARSDLGHVEGVTVHASSNSSALSIAYSWTMTFSHDVWTFSTPLYSMIPSLRILFMKKLFRVRVVPTRAARISWLIFGTIDSIF